MTTKSLALARKSHCLPIVAQALEKLSVAQAVHEGGESISADAEKERAHLDAERKAALLILKDVLDVSKG